jgi:hypothetical protein
VEKRAVVEQHSSAENQRIAQLEAELRSERVRRRGLLAILAGLAALELSRTLAPLVHPALALFGSVFCLIYVLYGLYLYSTQERFVRPDPARTPKPATSGQSRESDSSPGPSPG